ncbi:MAG: class I SAM-dependent methyltransferase [Allosphingosinicella sp.]|uniref:class I SAM-dependent methyltransferase n=1 Tax=Allosphingosinicella sp. TaxID=2823234 RepID=UPI003959DAEA
MIEPTTPQGQADVAGHYDELDQVYREIWGEHVHHGLWRSGRESVAEATDALSDLVAGRLCVKAGDHLADIGCGYGATAARFAGRLGVSVTGFTLSEEQARIARARPGPLTFHVRDWLANGMADASFDHVYAIESTEHMADKAGLFHEVARTLKPGGRFVVCAWLSEDSPSRWRVRHLLEPICREGRLPGMGTRGEYEDLAADAGLRTLSYEDLSRQVRRTWSIVTRRVAGRVLTTARYRRLLMSRSTLNRQFALSLPRLILAYRTGAMRYGVFTFEKS